MKLLLFLIGSFFFGVGSYSQQFRFDNVKYKTVYPEELCSALKKEKDYVLLDVRSRGEFSDTSSSTSYNLGHLVPAINIPVNELENRLQELKEFKNKPVYVYCSHSQRSRRASVIMADNGFTNIININGGMTQLLKSQGNMKSCFANLYHAGMSYTLLSAAQLAEKTKNGNPFYMIDIRSDSVFNGISQWIKQNAFGKFAEATHIPVEQLGASISTIPDDRPILITDESGNESPAAAELLNRLGKKDISVLFEGMTGWTEYYLSNKNNSGLHWISSIPFKMISAESFHKLVSSGSVAVIIDTREKDQFNNQSKNSWENIGRIKNAINIPFSEFENTSVQLPKDNRTAIILYHFTNHRDLFEAAGLLVSKGYSNVHILYGGIWNLRWAAHNIKGKSFLNDYVTEVPETNL